MKIFQSSWIRKTQQKCTHFWTFHNPKWNYSRNWFPKWFRIDKTPSQANRPLVRQQIIHTHSMSNQKIEVWMQCKCNWKVIFRSLSLSLYHFLSPARGERISCWLNFNYYSIKCQSLTLFFVLSFYRLWPMCVFMFLGLKLKHILADSVKWKKLQSEKNDFECNARHKTPAAVNCIVAFSGVILSAFQLLCHYSNRHKRLCAH